jgi:hypothetical protein
MMRMVPVPYRLMIGVAPQYNKLKTEETCLSAARRPAEIRVGHCQCTPRVFSRNACALVEEGGDKSDTFSIPLPSISSSTVSQMFTLVANSRLKSGRWQGFCDWFRLSKHRIAAKTYRL